MTKQLRLGTSDFDKIIEEDTLIVDKTLFIKEFMEDGVDVTCILRPRRFGKSTNLSMLKSFLSIGASPKNFNRYLIAKEEDFVKKYCGQYPVVYLHLKDCKGNSWEQMYKEIWLCVRKMVARHEKELSIALSVQDPFELSTPFSAAPADSTFVSSTLDWLLTNLYKYHKRRVIVLIDEYDTPLNHAFQKGYYTAASDFFGIFYSSALKENSALEKACLMGIVEIHGAGIFSGLNNIQVFSVSDKPYSSMFGFVESEVRTLLGDDLTQLKVIRDWYNGYSISSDMVVNPWSLMNYISRKTLADYWIGSSALETISIVLLPHVKTILTPIVAILTEKNGKFEISPLITRVDYSITDWKETSILHFLVHTGYLTYKSEKGKAFVSIPNQEVLNHWNVEVTKLMDVAFKPQFQYRLQNYLSNFDPDEMEELMKEMLPFCSFHDVSKQQENSYHMFYFGCFFITLHDGENVNVSSNKEAGYGRYDVKIEFRHLKKVIVFEFKRSLRDSNLDEDAKDGLAQAERKKYISDMSGYECLLIGVSFVGKTMSKLACKFIQN